VTLLAGDAVSGGILRPAPILAGADCVTTSTPGFNPFCGTSAAAPHVAALVALIKASVRSTAFLTRAGLVSMLQATAQRVGSTDGSGYNSVTGWGLPNTPRVISALQACPVGSYVDTTTLVCTVCSNARAVPAGSAGVEACTDPSTLPGATPAPAPVPPALTFYPWQPAGLSVGAIIGIAVGAAFAVALVIVVAYIIFQNRRR
jgi:hypothetical protein